MALRNTKRNTNLGSFRLGKGVKRHYSTFWNGIFAAGRLNQRKHICFSEKMLTFEQKKILYGIDKVKEEHQI